MNILVTGGAGYIGSHTLVALLEAGHSVVSIDNYSNSAPQALDRVREITKKDFGRYEGDVCSPAVLSEVFATHRIDAVIHFAGLKAVGESVEKPLEYYENNLISTLVLLDAMRKSGCYHLVFSSSATVYGEPQSLPIKEDAPLSATNPYGRTKLFIEEILRDMAKSDSRWKIGLLRYFNPVGAHPSGLIGEDPKGIPNNLFPYIARVAAGILPELRIFGGDYPTKDGTGVRDFIHVCDLAEGHVAAVENISRFSGADAINLGTGTGYSVLEAISEFASASGRAISYQIVGRRAGDIAACYADPSKAFHRLGWKARRTLSQMCEDHWRSQTMSADGITEGEKS
jgi:UDP-glucose 4-epimerase